MLKPLAAPALALLFCAVAAAWPGPAAATEADTQTMIEALMPTATRSLRSRVVRQKLGPAVSAASAASAASASQASQTSQGAVATPVSPALLTASAPAVAAATLPAVSAPALLAPPTAAGPAPSLALSIQFDPNSSRVRAESGSLLGNLVAALQSPELKGTRFIIEGHADARGVAERNLRLSQERADEVRLYLVALGVHPARLRAVGRGNSQPVNAGDPAAAENRRVRVVTVE